MDLISKTSQRLCTAEDMRNQTKLMMQPYANWEEYLTPAPLSIAILGELVFISSSTDFSINKKPPAEGYKYIKYPDSFRACLMQVCNSGWWAFNEAHKSMDQIRLLTAQVPDYMKTAVQILFQNNDEVVQAHLPDQLENISVIADECLELSNATEKRFTDVINIIHELLEVCMTAKNIYGEEQEEMKKTIQENELKMQTAEEIKKNTERAVRAMEEELSQANESYKKAMDSLPNAWEMIGMDVVGGITQSLTGMINGITSIISHPVRNACSATTKIANTVNQIRDKETVRDLVAEINVYSKSAEILKYVQNIQEQMKVNSEDDDIDWTNLYDQKHENTKSDSIKKQFERIRDDLKKIPHCPANQKAEKLCNDGIEICSQLAKYATQSKCDKDISTKIIHELLDLIQSGQVFDCEGKRITNSPAISPTTPMMFNEVNKSENTSPSQRATENARFKIEQSRAQMKETREIYEKCVENLQKSQRETAEILATLRNCQLKEIDFKTTIKMLVKGMDAMGRVKEQWEKMVHFFQMVSSIVKTSLNKTLKNFVKTSKKTQALSYDAKLVSKDLLYTQAFQASNIASLVHMISATYTDVSSKYLMDRVSSLGKLMTMDITKPDFKFEQNKLRSGCDEACNGILNLVQKNKNEFERKSTARLERIERELLAILPASPPEQMKRIKDVVETGSYY